MNLINIFKRKTPQTTEEINKKETKKDIVTGIQDLIKDSKDPREMAYSMLVHYLWDRDKLKMISRLDGDQITQIVKSLIIMSFYQKYWTERDCIISLKPLEKPPYYVKEINYYEPDYQNNYDPAFKETINDIMELLISKGGMGRSEIIDILNYAEKEMSMKERAGNMISNAIK